MSNRKKRNPCKVINEPTETPKEVLLELARNQKKTRPAGSDVVKRAIMREAYFQEKVIRKGMKQAIEGSDSWRRDPDVQEKLTELKGRLEQKPPDPKRFIS